MDNMAMDMDDRDHLHMSHGLVPESDMSEGTPNGSDAAEATSRTLFVADIPAGMNEAEFSQLFRSRSEEAFVGARLRRDRHDHVVGFVDYATVDAAIRAKAIWEGFKVHAQAERGFTVHFSHSQPRRRPERNARTPPSRQEDGYSGVMAMGGVGDGFSSTYMGNPHGRIIPTGGYPPSYSPSLFIQEPFPPSSVSSGSVSYTTLPFHASPTLYVEGLPLDATEREVAHIFRHYAGFLSVRILPKESKSLGRSYHLCFVEFETPVQSSFAMHALQGYKMHMQDSNGLLISFAKSERHVRHRTQK